MPRGDRTGPLGLGPGTGRRLGYCLGYDTPGYTKLPGAGLGRGYGRGFCHWPPVWRYSTGHPWTYPVRKEDEIRFLKTQAENLSRAQKDIEKRLSELEKKEE